jgi:mono/diheme cytochrome c family protein
MFTAVILLGCTAHGDNPGREYAPNMYHSVAYEPLSQITDTEAGAWANSLEHNDPTGKFARTGEYYNSNNYNPNRMTQRMPPPHTIKRNPYNWLPYRSKNVPKDSVPIVTANLRNPLDSTAAVVAQGQLLYSTYCQHCHGAKGAGDGKVADKFAGVANLTGDAYLKITEGHIFHVITYGAGLMGSHGSQVSPEDRWRIAKYVKALQKKK